MTREGTEQVAAMVWELGLLTFPGVWMPEAGVCVGGGGEMKSQRGSGRGIASPGAHRIFLCMLTECQTLFFTS